VRGFAPFYDQRIWPTDTSNNTIPIPQRLNFLEKTGSRLEFNGDYAGSGSGVIDGNGGFESINSRAKFVVYGDRAYAVDDKTPMKVFRRKNKADQTYLARIKYAVRNAGIKWPTAGTSDAADLTQKPTATASGAGNPTLGFATFRFRIVIEDEFGIQSSPSMFVAYTHASGDTKTTVTVKWDTIYSTFPAEVQASPTKYKVRLYCQITLTSSTDLEPSAYRYIRSSVDTDAAARAAGIVFDVNDQVDMQNRDLMLMDASAPPILTDMCVVDDIAYGASSLDVVYREVPEGQQVGTFIERYSNRAPGAFLIKTKLLSKTKISAINVNRSYLFFSNPGEPEYMYHWRQVGNGTEIIVGVVPLGKVCVILTNQGVYTYSAIEDEMHTGFARVGCIARDTIVATENGIRFVGTDGIPRLFNGATVDEVADEMLPIFDRDDYQGDYSKFDSGNAQEVVGTYGDRKFFMLFPASNNPSGYKPGHEADPSVPRYMAIGDSSRGPTRWSLDRAPSWESIYWLGRESRMLAIDAQGYHYFIEEGLTDEQPAGDDFTNPTFAVKARRFSAGGVQGQFYKVKLDVNTQGETVSLFAQMDDMPAVTYQVNFSTTRREEVIIDLPANFKGRYMDLRLSGSVAARFQLFGILPEVVTRGVF
jgi:hypothetical protein